MSYRVSPRAGADLDEIWTTGEEAQGAVPGKRIAGKARRDDSGLLPKQ